MAEWLVGVAIVAEPYFILPRDDWVGDVDGMVAIISSAAAGSSPIERAQKGRGWVSASIKGITIIGVYFSPNRTLAEFEAFLAILDSAVGQSHHSPVLVAGDFNAKCTAWGSPATNPRGAALQDWATGAGLMLLNQGSVNTCVRQRGGSIVDLSLASPALARRVHGWSVLEEVETLSDHRYIRFSVCTENPGAPARAPTSTCGPKWAIKRLDPELVKEAALVQSWVMRPGNFGNVDDGAELSKDIMSLICDAAMPRVGPTQPRRRVYWWSEHIALLRSECTAIRRQYTRQRRLRRRDQQAADQEDALYRAYVEAKKALSMAISESKARAREELLETLNRDPWGRPYLMVRQKLRPWAPPLTQSLEPQLLDGVMSVLFPDSAAHRPPNMAVSAAVPEDAEESVPSVTEAEMRAVMLRLRAKNTAPGPDGVPGRAYVLAHAALEQWWLSLFDACLEQGRFPLRWKTGKLVMLRKKGRPADSPSAYRPIVLLDEAGKLFERVIANRLNQHLAGVGPDLADCQYGFRVGRSTVGAIQRVKEAAEDAVSRGEVLLAVSLDIANAFNTLPWASIREALRSHGVPIYLRRIIESYLSERTVIYPTKTGWGRREVVCGVPQGSVLGPLLWNIGYNWVLRGELLQGVTVVCYADDTLVLARANEYRRAALLATAGTAQVVARIRRLGLEVALEKSEAICFHRTRNGPPSGAELIVGGSHIAVGATMRYLGLVLDSKWNFRPHFRQLVPKLMGAAGALSRLLPNLGGPSASCRRLYNGVVRAMALYGAPIWADGLAASNIAMLRRPQRVMAARVIRGYRTISFEAGTLLAGLVPWDLEAKALASLYRWREEVLQRDERPAFREVEARRAEFCRSQVAVWRRRLERPSAGIATIEAVRPVMGEWLARRHGTLSFRLTQVLSGHGCFGSFLCRIGREQTSGCHHCNDGAEDTSAHTVQECVAWQGERDMLAEGIGRDLSLPAIVRAMVGSGRAWAAISTFCERVMLAKEEAEREREITTLLPSRRRRVRQRNQRTTASDDLHPP